eukprot:1298676-Rhodomonas_salina.1
MQSEDRRRRISGSSMTSSARGWVDDMVDASLVEASGSMEGFESASNEPQEVDDDDDDDADALGKDLSGLGLKSDLEEEDPAGFLQARQESDLPELSDGSL